MTSMHRRQQQTHNNWFYLDKGAVSGENAISFSTQRSSSNCCLRWHRSSNSASDTALKQTKQPSWQHSHWLNLVHSSDFSINWWAQATILEPIFLSSCLFFPSWPHPSQTTQLLRCSWRRQSSPPMTPAGELDETYASSCDSSPITSLRANITSSTKLKVCNSNKQQLWLAIDVPWWLYLKFGTVFHKNLETVKLFVLL